MKDELCAFSGTIALLDSCIIDKLEMAESLLGDNHADVRGLLADIKEQRRVIYWAWDQARRAAVKEGILPFVEGVDDQEPSAFDI